MTTVADPLDALVDTGHLGRDLSKGLITGIGSLLPLLVLMGWLLHGRLYGTKGAAWPWASPAELPRPGAR